MSGKTPKKTPVRVICPHCRRAYFINVDLRRLYHTKPRAICSRCGGKFEVIHRMFELEDSSTTRISNVPPAQESDTVLRNKRKRLAAATKRRQQAKKSDVDEKPEDGGKETSRASRQVPVTDRLAGVYSRSVGSRGKPHIKNDRSALPSRSQSSPKSSTSTSPSPAPDQWALDKLHKQVSQQEGRYRDEVRQGELKPSDSPLLLESEPEVEDTHTPSPADLEDPMPWVQQMESNIDALVPSLSKRAKDLEWLLNERPRRPKGASPPPIPMDIKQHLTPTPPPKPEKD